MDYIYVEHLTSDATTLDINGDAARHIKALRLRTGESVGVLNGKGLVARCTVNQGRTLATLVVDTIELVAQPPTTVLALGLLDHKDRFEFALEKVVELGATLIIPLVTQYVQHKRATPERWRSKIVSAVTQSGNAWVPKISDAYTLQQSLAHVAHCDMLFVADSEGNNINTVPSAASVAIFVGPEGGFDPAELDLLRSQPNASFVRLSNNRLRAETAAIASVALIQSLRS